MSFPPTAYTPATSGSSNRAEDHFSGIDDELGRRFALFTSDGTTFPAASATSPYVYLVQGHNSPLLPDGLYTKASDNSGYDWNGAGTIWPVDSVTLADLQSAASAINTDGRKQRGYPVYVSDVHPNGGFAMAVGAAAADVWIEVGTITMAAPA